MQNIDVNIEKCQQQIYAKIVQHSYDNDVADWISYKDVKSKTSEWRIVNTDFIYYGINNSNVYT